MSHTSKPSFISRPLCQARLLLPQGSQDLATLIDTVSDTNIIDNDLALLLGVSWIRLPVTVPANALDGHLIGIVTHQTVPIHMLPLMQPLFPCIDPTTAPLTSSPALLHPEAACTPFPPLREGPWTLT